MPTLQSDSGHVLLGAGLPRGARQGADPPAFPRPSLPRWGIGSAQQSLGVLLGGSWPCFLTRWGLTPAEMLSASLDILDVAEGGTPNPWKLSLPISSVPITPEGKQ